jgi:hypothetical protein
MAWPPQSGQGTKSIASPGPGNGLASAFAEAAEPAGRRIKPGRSVQRQVSQSMVRAPIPPRNHRQSHRGVSARSSDSRNFRNVFAAS